MNASIAYLALGANLGDRRANLDRALGLLRAMGDLRVTKVSSFLENLAVGGPPGSPAFLNAAAEIETTLPPRELLARLLNVEHQLGRERREKWGPRLIDLDLLLYGDQTIAEPNLQIPHPLMHERRFVLEPLAEIAPDVLHPTFGMSIRDLFKRLVRA
ncbi:MAG: 2-amino-4-hydroxy-6-hydroxymethyldihydropteridine diphosphokinase [Tepidisphaeraceae bacterium]